MQKVEYALIAATLGIVLILYIAILMITGGHFVYSLDDPYISLALAENLAHFGHYGVNLQEYASPSSSILFPFLLVPFYWLRIAAYGPLIINTISACGSVLLLFRFLSRTVPLAAGIRALASVGIFFLVGGFSLIFIGLEHSLHLLDTLAVFYLLSSIIADSLEGVQTKQIVWAALFVTLVVQPFIRLEGLAIVVAASIILLALHHRSFVFASFAAIFAGLGVYGAAMKSLGLPVLPSSVLAKESVLTTSTAAVHLKDYFMSMVSAIQHTFLANLADATSFGIIFLVLLISLTPFAKKSLRERKVMYAMGVGGITVTVLHLAFGAVGSFARYESYAVLWMVCTALYLHRDFLISRIADLSIRWWQVGILALSLVFLFRPFSIEPFLKTPAAAQSMYLQPYQMHRLVTDFLKSPIAVNDLGWVSFENDEYVLDLFGLGSEEARIGYRTKDPNYIDRLTSNHDVHVALLSDWFISEASNFLPNTWRKIGSLQLDVPLVTAGSSKVGIYVFGLSSTQCTGIFTKLEDFQKTLPLKTTMELLPNGCSI